MHLRNVINPNYGVKRHTPTNLVSCGDEGLLRESGDRVDLHVLLTGNSPHVRLFPISSNIMRPTGLMRGSIAVVDRGMQPKADSVVMVRYNGIEVIRHLKKQNGVWKLLADDPRVEELTIGENDIVEKLGVVTASITILI